MGKKGDVLKHKSYNVWNMENRQRVEMDETAYREAKAKRRAAREQRRMEHRALVLQSQARGTPPPPPLDEESDGASTASDEVGYVWDKPKQTPEEKKAAYIKRCEEKAAAREKAMLSKRDEMAAKYAPGAGQGTTFVGGLAELLKFSAAKEAERERAAATAAKTAATAAREKHAERRKYRPDVNEVRFDTEYSFKKRKLQDGRAAPQGRPTDDARARHDHHHHDPHLPPPPSRAPTSREAPSHPAPAVATRGSTQRDTPVLPPDLAAAVDILGPWEDAPPGPAAAAAVATHQRGGEGAGAHTQHPDGKYVERVYVGRGRVVERRVDQRDLSHAFGGRDLVEHGRLGETPWYARGRGGGGDADVTAPLSAAAGSTNINSHSARVTRGEDPQERPGPTCTHCHAPVPTAAARLCGGCSARMLKEPNPAEALGLGVRSTGRGDTDASSSSSSSSSSSTRRRKKGEKDKGRKRDKSSKKEKKKEKKGKKEKKQDKYAAMRLEREQRERAERRRADNIYLD